MDPGARSRAEAARAQFAESCGGMSDHLAVVGAFDAWEAAKASGSESQWCSRNFVSPGTMQVCVCVVPLCAHTSVEGLVLNGCRGAGGASCVTQTIRGMRQQLANELIHRRLVTDVRWASGNRRNTALVRAILAAGMYPQMGAVLPPAMGQQATAKPTIQHPSGQKVRIHVGYPFNTRFHLLRTKELFAATRRCDNTKRLLHTTQTGRQCSPMDSVAYEPPSVAVQLRNSVLPSECPTNIANVGANRAGLRERAAGGTAGGWPACARGGVRRGDARRGFPVHARHHGDHAALAGAGGGPAGCARAAAARSGGRHGRGRGGGGAAGGGAGERERETRA